MKVENCIENSVAFSSVIPSELTKFPVVTNSPSLEKNYSSVDFLVSLSSASRSLGRVSEERQTASRDLWEIPTFPWITWSSYSGPDSRRSLESGVTKDEKLCPKERAQSSFLSQSSCVLISLDLTPKREGFPWN